MSHTRLVILIVSGALFAGAHWFALAASLYWYYWWFDIMMHFWGGGLVILCWYNLVVFPRWYVPPTLPRVLLVLLAVTVGWEVFEWAADLWQPETYISDTIQDIFLGFSGGLLTYGVMRTDTIK